MTQSRRCSGGTTMVHINIESLERHMDRRHFITFSAASLAWLQEAGAQQAAVIRRVAMLLAVNPDDTEYPSLVKAFLDGMRQAGWAEGANLRLDIRWAGGSVDGIAKTQLVASRTCGGKTVTLVFHYVVANGDRTFAFQPPNHFLIRSGALYIQ